MPNLSYYSIKIFLISGPVTCPSLIEPDNGEVSVSSNTFGSVVSYICTPGYVLTPSNGGVRVCEEDGQWTGVAPTCPRELHQGCCVKI